MSDGDVFFRIQLLWGVAPPILLTMCVATWLLLSTCKSVNDLEIKIKTSCVALLYLVWPSLCSQTFSLFACRSVCGDTITFLRADLDVSCWEGIHAHYAVGVGFPMLFLYVIGLPVAALWRVRRMHQATVVDPEEKKVYGMFYTAFREETWWWEITVAARKIVIALIGVFGTNLEDMQVHLTLMLVMFILLVTSQIRPFGGKKHGVLHVLEMASLMATFLTLWAGSIFNTRPRCEDPLKGEGSTLGWCDALSVTVGLVDIVVLGAIGVCFVYMKVASTSTEAMETAAVGIEAENEEKDTEDAEHIGIEMGVYNTLQPKKEVVETETTQKKQDRISSKVTAGVSSVELVELATVDDACRENESERLSPGNIKNSMAAERIHWEKSESMRPDLQKERRRSLHRKEKRDTGFTGLNNLPSNKRDQEEAETGRSSPEEEKKEVTNSMEPSLETLVL